MVPAVAAARGDTRIATLDAAIRREQHRPDALLGILHLAQDLYGYLPRHVLAHVARGMHLPPSHVLGVATFYHLFSLAPKGAHTCTVCVGTACDVSGARQILAAVEHAQGIRAGETSADGTLTLAIARCVGACGAAPAILYDGRMAGEQDRDAVLARVGEGRSP